MLLLPSSARFWARGITSEVCHEKTDLKVFVIVIRKEGWARVAAPILLLV